MKPNVFLFKCAIFLNVSKPLPTKSFDVKRQLHCVSDVQKLPSTSPSWKSLFFGQVLPVTSAFFSFLSLSMLQSFQGNLQTRPVMGNWWLVWVEMDIQYL